MRAAVGRGQCARIALAQELFDRGVGEKRQIAGQHQPGSCGMCGERRADADDGTFARHRSPRSSAAGPAWDPEIWSARTDTKTVPHMPAGQFEGAIQLGLALILERRLVALHARARAACEDQTIDRGDAHGATA